MTNSKATTLGGATALLLPGALFGAICVGLGATGVQQGPARGVRPTSPIPEDADGDGLVDRLETVLGTVFVQADTDQDGFSDAEEFARQSSPLFAESTPDSAEVRVGMSAYGANGQIHAVIGVYSADGNFHDKNITFGLMLHGVLMDISSDSWLHTAQIQVLPGAAPGARIALLDIPFSPNLVHASRDLSMFSTISLPGSGAVADADSIHLASVLGVVVLVTEDPTVMSFSMMAGGGGGGRGGGGRGGSQAMTSESSGGTIYIPLTTDSAGDLLNGWTQGQICMQTTSAVGSDGMALTQQVDSAECQSGYEGACPSTCSASVGTTFTTVDPVVLIGG